jgi:hypothetical protein
LIERYFLNTIPSYITTVAGPKEPFKITGVIYSDYIDKNGKEYLHNRYIHESVYGHVSNLAPFKNELNNKENWIHDMLDYAYEERMAEFGARVAYISRQYRANISSLYNKLKAPNDALLIPRPFIDDEVALNLPANIPNEVRAQSMERLKRMFHCTPNQGVGNNLTKQYSCNQYRLCPWCRYEKVHHIYTKLFATMKDDMHIHVTQFSTPCDRQNYDVNSDAELYAKAIKSACKGKNRGWKTDFVITLPCRVKTASCDRSKDNKYNMVWQTTIIALADIGAKLQHPEEAFPKTKNFETRFMSDGLWHQFPPTKAGLCDAFKKFAEYPLWMLSRHHDPHFVADVLTTLQAGDRDRAVGHGI